MSWNWLAAEFFRGIARSPYPIVEKRSAGIPDHEEAAACQPHYRPDPLATPVLSHSSAYLEMVDCCWEWVGGKGFLR